MKHPKEEGEEGERKGTVAIVGVKRGKRRRRERKRRGKRGREDIRIELQAPLAVLLVGFHFFDVEGGSDRIHKFVWGSSLKIGGGSAVCVKKLSVKKDFMENGKE